MPAPHYAAWLRHLTRHPPTEERTHYLLARVIQVLAATAGQTGQGWDIWDIAPWLPGKPVSTVLSAPQQAVMDALLEGRVRSS